MPFLGGITSLWDTGIIMALYIYTYIVIHFMTIGVSESSASWIRDTQNWLMPQAKSTIGSETPHLCGLEGTKTHSFQPLQRECLAVELPGTPCSHVPLHSKHGDMLPPQGSAASCVRPPTKAPFQG